MASSLRRRLACVALALVPSLAVADEKPPAAHELQRPESRPDLDPDTERARRHFDRGVQLYDDGQYQEAVREFTAANEARPSPALDFNIARCQERLEQWGLAVASYQRFLDGKPGAAEVVQVRKRLEVIEPLAARARADEEARQQAEKERALHERAAREQAEKQRVEQERVEHERAARALLDVDRRAARRRGNALVGAAAVATLLTLGAAAAGVALVASVGGGYRDLHDGTCARRYCSDADWQSLQSLASTGDALLGAAAGLFVVDVALWSATGWARARAGKLDRLYLAPSGTGAVVGGTF